MVPSSKLAIVPAVDAEEMSAATSPRPEVDHLDGRRGCTVPAVPVALGWTVLSLALGRNQERRAAKLR